MRNGFAALMLLVCTSAAGADPKDWAYGVEPPPLAIAGLVLERAPLEIQLSSEGVNRFCGGILFNVRFLGCTMFGVFNIGDAAHDIYLPTFERQRIAGELVAAQLAKQTPCIVTLPWVGSLGAPRDKQDAIRAHERAHCWGYVHHAARGWFKDDGTEVY